VAEYTPVIRHIAGINDIVAKTLFRPPAACSPPLASLAAAAVKVPAESVAAASEAAGCLVNSPSTFVAVTASAASDVNVTSRLSAPALRQSQQHSHPVYQSGMVLSKQMQLGLGLI
jgi:hypothetical protein